MLCQVCKDGFEGIGRTKRCLEKSHTAKLWRREIQGTPVRVCFCVHEQHPFGHHPDELSFERSAKQGCVVCSNLSDDGNQENETQTYGFYTIFILSLGDSVTKFNVTIKSSRNRTKMIELIPSNPLFGSGLNYDLHGSTDSPQTSGMIAKWMNTCSSSHETCRSQARGSRYKPTRLLQTNFHNLYIQGSPTFQLVRGRSAKNSPYVTVSYRWGNKSFDNTIKLLEETSDSLHEWSLISRLPRTIRDAMYIAHKFGIKYIWIDRLCIYQDSPEDWHNEARTVGDTYKNASFCVAALSGEDDEGGCLFTRDTTLVAPTRIQLNRMSGTFRADAEDTAYNTGFQNEPLVKRGWVLQERIMSPRTIYFGRNQVYWECAELHACETHPTGFGGFSRAADSSGPNQHLQQCGKGLGPWKQLIATPITQTATADWRMQLFASWSAAISVYSGTELTDPNDKLVAVSGLAQDIQNKLEPELGTTTLKSTGVHALPSN